MTAAHTFFSLYFSTGKPAPIRNAEGPLVTLPFHPRWLRHSLTMIHFCPHPAPGGLGWSRQSPGGAEMRRAQEPQTPLKGGTCLFSERGPFL